MNNISFPKSMLEDKDNGERDFVWVDIDARTPNESGEYLVTLTDNAVMQVMWGVKGFTYYGNVQNVTAWAKIPKPFKKFNK
jgi:hypothetical protein